MLCFFMKCEIIMKTKIIAILTIFLDVLGLTIIIPAMPQLVQYYHTNNTMISLGFTIYSLLALVATPLLGTLSDKYWRKPVLIYSTIWTILSYLTIAISPNVWIFLFARAINGMSAGNVWAAQSILSDISKDHKDRTVNLWLFWVIFWLGFVIWPAIGWLLLKSWIKTPFIVSGILCILNLILIIFVLPETNKLIDKLKKISLKIVKVFEDMFVSPEKYRYLVFGLVNLALMIYQMSFLLYLSGRFGVSGTNGWLILGAFWIVMVINQWFILKHFWLKKFNSRQLLQISLLWLTACYGLSFLFESLRVVVILVWISGIFQWIVRPVFSDIILGNNKDIWLINWNLVNLGNLASIIWPLLGGFLIDKNITPFALVTLLMTIAFVLFRRKKILLHKKEL